jgi:hypothetical protein
MPEFGLFAGKIFLLWDIMAIRPGYIRDYRKNS